MRQAGVSTAFKFEADSGDSFLASARLAEVVKMMVSQTRQMD